LEDLLEVSRFDAEVAVLEPVEFDLVRLIERCIEDVRANAQDHTISVQIDHETEQVMIKADIRRVERIMRNLLSNALDHADEKPIQVSVVATATEVGVGVMPGERLDTEHISFSPFRLLPAHRFPEDQFVRNRKIIPSQFNFN